MNTAPVLINHLSKEIVTQTNGLMTFRARINFAVFVGPFVLLGSLLYGSRFFPQVTNKWVLVISVLIIVLSYLTMGWVCASIEIHVWRQCNRWRNLIADLSSGAIDKVTPGELRFDHKLRLGYMVVYSVMAVAFVCVLLLILLSRTN